MYVDMTGVSAKLTALRPSACADSLSTCMLDRATSSEGTTRVVLNAAFHDGSSPAWERAASVRGLELRGGQVAFVAGIVQVPAAVEAAQAVVQLTGERH